MALVLEKGGGERVLLEEEVSVKAVKDCFEFDGRGDGGGVNMSKQSGNGDS